MAAARAAEDAASNGGDPHGLRVDRCKTSLMNLFSPDVDEQIRYGLTGLRGPAARADARRRAAGVPLRHEHLADRLAWSKKLSKPWEAMGLSRSAYYRRLKLDPASVQAAEATPQADPSEMTISSGGVELIAAAVRLAVNPCDGRAALTVAADSGIGDVADEAASNADMRDVFQDRANAAAGTPREEEAWLLSQGLVTLCTALASGTSADEAFDWFAEGGMGVFDRAWYAPGPRTIKLDAVRTSARGCRTASDWATRLEGLEVGSMPLAMAA